MTMDALHITNWHSCYDDSWKGVIVEEAFAHPAKFAYGLITRIVDHGLRQGYWMPGDLIGDPFGGVALGGIAAGCRGLNWIGVELEQKFVDLGNQNLALHGPTFMASGASMVKLVQGDSRRFAEIVGHVCGVVTSPPYSDAESTQAGGPRTLMPDGKPRCWDGEHGYGTTEGQIGALRAGTLDAVVTSPPYADSIKGEHAEQETAEESRSKRKTQGGPLGKSQRHGGYGGKENIGNLKEGTVDGIVTSPPWEDNSEGGLRGPKFKDPEAFAAAMSAKDGSKPNRHAASRKARVAQLERDANRIYGTSPGQIGRESGETYWQAMHAVYSQMLQAMKPGAVAAIVVKDYVAKGKRVPLCDDTCRLLEHLGFTVFERSRCWLVKEHKQPGLFGVECVERTERKSFFRRLAEKKGSPRIDWEEVIWART